MAAASRLKLFVALHKRCGYHSRVITTRGLCLLLLPAVWRLGVRCLRKWVKRE